VRAKSQHTWAFLAGEWQVVAAGYVVPLAILMPDHHHTVFSRSLVVIRLVWPPVLVLLWKRKCYKHTILHTISLPINLRSSMFSFSLFLCPFSILVLNKLMHFHLCTTYTTSVLCGNVGLEAGLFVLSCC